jgi:acetyl-CoA carboxylase biotin carboxyl carrier protein
MTVEEIKELIHIVNESGIAELEVQRGENRVRIRRSIAPGTQEILLAQSSPTIVSAGQSGNSFAHQGSYLPPAPATASPEPERDLIFVKSPIVGTFYESPSPESKAFVNVGERVSSGQVLCIIESMKLMNEIEAEVAGIIVSKLVENGQPVEYGEPLFSVRPA